MANLNILTGGRNTADADYVSCDQETVLGDGTIQNPLRAANANTFTAVSASNVAVVPGNILCRATFGGFHAALAKADALSTSHVFGIALIDNGGIGGDVDYQFAGIVELTTDEWDVVAGTSGGLVPGAGYYVSSATAGLLTGTAPSAGGTYQAQAGIALSTTQLQLQFGPPIAN